VIEFQIALVLFETDHQDETSKPIQVFVFDGSLLDPRDAIRHFEVLKNAIMKGIQK